MAKLKTLYIIALLSYFSANGQIVGPAKTASTLDLDSRAGGQVAQIPMKPVETIGTSLLYDDWALGTITITENKVVENYLINYDLEKDELLIKTDEDVRVLRGYRVQSFDISQGDGIKRHFINSSNHLLDGTPLTGFLEVLVNDDVMLFSKTKISIKAPSYNIQIDYGKRADEILKVESFYIAEDENIMLIGKSKKKSLSLFGDQTNTIDNFMKKNKLKFKSKEDLIKIVEYYNSIKS